MMSGDGKGSFLRASMASIKERGDDAATAKTVPFAVVSCSSQDEDFPGSELNKGVLGRGWQSSRFCFFPQEIVLELQQPSRIINMQLLCHEFKIPSKVEVFVSMMNPYIHSEHAVAQMKRLGYLSLDPNDRSGHQARELKSIYVDSSAAAIRLLLHNCYTNKLNVYNPVGLMAVIITGDPLEGQQTEYFSRHDVTTPGSHVSMIQVACTKGMESRTQAPSPKAVDFDFTEVDSATGSRLRQLFQDKIMAVGNEDYDEAKRLKISNRQGPEKILIERLKKLGKKMKQLERRKFAAVEVEDYDTAKLCKIEMERLQHNDEGLLEDGQIDQYKSSDRLELGAATLKTSVSLQGRSSCEDMISATFSAIGKREIWTQTVEDANLAVQLNKRAEGSGNRTSCNVLLDSKPAYSSFKIQQGDFQGLTIPTVVLSNEKQSSDFVPETLPWYWDHSVLKTSEISPPPTVGQQGISASAPATTPPTALIEPPSQNVIRGPRISLRSGASREESSETCDGSSAVASPSASTASLPSTGLFDIESPQLAPLKLMADPELMSNMRTTSIGTQYQIDEKLPILASPMREEFMTPTTTPRRVPELVSDHEGTLTPEPRHYGQDSSVATFRAQEQALPFHKGDFQSPFPNGDELVPEPLADSVKMEAGPLLSIIDVHQVECLYSKHWQLREKALQFLTDTLNANKLVDEPVPSFRMMNKVLLRTLNDRVANVFNTSLQLLRTVVTTYASVVPHRDLHISSSGFTAILLEKLGDLNARTKEGSFETLMFLASKKEIGIHVLSGPLLKLPKNHGIWRPVLGRLQLLVHAVPLYGIQPPSRTGFPSDALMNFVTQAFNSPNGEVRNAAIKVTIEVYRLMGPPIDKYLKGIKPLITEILTSNFERVAYESEQGDDTYYQERTFSADEPGMSLTRAGQNVGLRPLVQDQIEEQEFIDNKGHEMTASFSKAEGSPNRSSLLGQEQKVEEPESRVVDADSPTKNSPSFSHAATSTKVQETRWAYSQQSSSSVDKTVGVIEAEAASESVRSHDSDGEASLDTSSRPPWNVDHDFPMEKDESADLCLFCGKHDARFKEGDNLDLHFCEQCPMLASCSNCGQIVEISSLKDHYLFECASGKRYVECQKCYLAVPESRLAAHQKCKDCKMCKQHKLLRCPLCFRTVEPSDKGWREHILQQPGCLRNPRTLIHTS